MKEYQKTPVKIKEQFEIQKAIKFLVDACLDSEGNQKKLRTDKPLVAHSLRVGFYLQKFGYPKDLIIAGILHDLIEDTSVTIKYIKEKFGKRTADIISSLSYSQNLTSIKGRYTEMYQRTKKAGRDAIIVSCADRFDNIDYVKYHDEEMIRKLKEKYHYFLKYFTEISTEPIYQELKRKFLNKL